MLIKICYDFVIIDEINIYSFRHNLGARPNDNQKK